MRNRRAFVALLSVCFLAIGLSHLNAQTGKIALIRDDGDGIGGGGQVWIMDADGSNLRQVTFETGKHGFWSVRLSPGGRRITMLDRFYLWVVDSDGNNLRPLPGPEPYGYPTWTPDGKQVVYRSIVEERCCLYFVNPDTSETGVFARKPGKIHIYHRAFDLSPDGTQILFTDYNYAKMIGLNLDIFRVNKDGGNLQHLVDELGYDYLPQWSPDGRKFLFRSRRDDGWGWYVRDIRGKKERLVTKAYDSLMWSPDQSRFLAFHEGRLITLGMFGGDPRPIGTLTDVLSVDWIDPGTAVSAVDNEAVVWGQLKARRR